MSRGYPGSRFLAQMGSSIPGHSECLIEEGEITISTIHGDVTLSTGGGSNDERKKRSVGDCYIHSYVNIFSEPFNYKGTVRTPTIASGR